MDNDIAKRFETHLYSFIERAESCQVNEGGLVNGQPDAHAQNSGSDDLKKKFWIIFFLTFDIYAIVMKRVEYCWIDPNEKICYCDAIDISLA